MRSILPALASLTLAVAASALAAALAPALAQTSAPASPTPASPTPASPATAPAPATPPAPSNTRTTQDLADLCGTPEGDPTYPGHIGLCVGYFSGVLDYHLADTRGNRRTRKVCLPAAMPTRGQERTAFLAWAHANQQYADQPAVYGVMRFLISQYPCKR